MKKIFLTLLAVLSILAFITACGDSTGGNPLIQPENGTGDNSTETNPTDTPSTGGGIAKSLKDRITEAKAGDIIDLGVEKLSITEGESYTISKAITIKNGDAKDGTFTVETTGAKLLNLRNINSIIADEKIQDGDLNIINCYEIDSIYVNGGGANSIHISSTTVTNLFVQKENVRVILEAATSNEEGSNAEGQSKTATVKNIQIKTDCKLDSTDKNAIFENVQISSDVEKVTLAGSANIDKILAETNENATVEIESAEVKIEKTSENVKLVVAENSQIQIPSVDKIDTYYTVTVLAYPFAQGSMKLPEGFLFSTEEITFEDVQLEGWYLDSLFTQKATFPHVVNSDVTFYAKFILDKKCKIIFYGNDFINEKTFDYGTLIKESDIPDLTEDIKEHGLIWEGWYLDIETTQPLTFPFVITRDITLYPKYSKMDSGDNDCTIPVISQEDFEFTVGTWLCEQTSKQGSLDSMIQTTTSKLVFTITETLPTSSIQAIAEKHETIVTYASQYFSSYEQAKQQYPTSVPEYEFTFDDANLTITMVASKESLNEITAGYSAITYEQFVSGYLTFGDTIENVTNSEKTILKSINNPDSNIKIETIFVKIADDNSGNSGTGNSGNTGDSGDESGETIVDTNDPFYGLTSFTMENDESTYLVDSENKTITKISDTPLFVYTYDYKIEDDKTILTLSFEKIKSIIDVSKLVTVDECIEELNSMQLEEAQLNYYLFSLRNPKKYSLVINERADTSANVTIEGYYDSSVKWYDQISGSFICQYDNMDYESVTRTTLQGYLSKAVKEFIYTYQTADNTTQIIYTTISIDDSKIIIKSVDDDNVSKTIPYTKSESSNNAVITIDFGDFTTDLTWEGSTYLGL